MENRVPIPRLPNRHTGRENSGRVSRACDKCRSRKMKCDGDKPICGQCASANLGSCNYSESKKIRERNELKRARRRADRYEKLLREISHEVELPAAKKIERALRGAVGEPASREDTSVSSSSSSVGSLDGLDVLDEDLNESEESRATGYFGKSSEVAWIRGLESEANLSGNKDEFESSRKPTSPRSASTASMNYHQEPANYPGEEVNNLYSLPAKALAERLVMLFMDTVQPSLPIIRQDLFIDQFNSLYSESSRHPGRKWLAVLNLVFAISTKLCQLSGQDIQNHGHQFFSRAQTLNLSESLVQDHEDLQQVQIETLAAFYLLNSSHINRAWKMIGTAARSSISLGLHLRATHNKLNAEALEARHKLWWSIFILEDLLSVMTGRPSGLGYGSFSAPPPLASEDMNPFTNNAPNVGLDRLSENPPMKWTMDQEHTQLEAQRNLTRTMDATNELYFFCLADLTRISRSASTRVYSPTALKQGWKGIQSRIDFYNGIMLDWRSGLPDSMSIEQVEFGPDLSIKDAFKVSLAMHYHSSRLILNRPCLTRKKDGENYVRNRLSRSRGDIEMTCLHSALALLAVFPEQPNRDWFRRVPWWLVLHFLVQATAVLLINLSFDHPLQGKRSQNSTVDFSSDRSLQSCEFAHPEAILTTTKKALLWLFDLGKMDDSARRAFDICNNCLRRIESRLFDLDTLASANNAIGSNAPKEYDLDVPTDDTHQQYRSRLNVSHSEFTGTRDFGFDQNMGDAASLLGSAGTEDFEFLRPSIGTLGMDVDMSDYVPDPEIATLEQMLEPLA